MDTASLATPIVNQFVTAWNSPVPFLAAVLLGWLMMRSYYAAHYKERLEAKDATIEHKDYLLQDYKEKLSGATPDEAKQRLDALEAAVRAVTPKRIPAEVGQRIVPLLAEGAGALIEIGHEMAAADVKPLFDDLCRVLTSAGWTVSQFALSGQTNPPPCGIQIELAFPDSPTLPQRAVLSGLREAALEFVVVKREMPQFLPTDRKADLRLLVTSPKRD